MPCNQRGHATPRDVAGKFAVGRNGDAVIDKQLLWSSLGIAVLVGLGLELANHLFLAKRQRIHRLTEELHEARESGRQLQKVIREAGRM